MTTLKLGDGFPKIRSELAPQVKQLQGMLKNWGYDVNESGHFDWATDGAVLHFQEKVVGLPKPDGKVTVDVGRTWKTLSQPVPAVLPGRSFTPDALYPVPFIDQFDEVHVIGAGQKGCFAAADTMLHAVGVQQAGKYETFRIITKETWKGDVPTQSIDPIALATGVVYLDAQLLLGRAVMLGVSYGDQPADPNKRVNEGLTEHWVVVFEKTSEGKYRFHDPATAHKAQGANREFSFDPTTKNLTAEGIPGQERGAAIGRRYYMTQIRKNLD
ncbi:peptidoglycan-binding domain-containing protein [Polyangium mundeleinium]|uniref:Peptidoglycan-binding domain-containing protein n=1 Tax=Polyangium mundeleinium TaxID=2995306 RepID=A0ABT5EFU1_9BACT|nr:peptidoglycan-binding domain-containing protein [Polyangium mundeleinium]MDC0740693.1 peptidoglycan-binding domain-containing protein [Polyangium mundeleinium]